MYISDIHWPGIAVTMSDGDQPFCFDREICCSKDILDGLFDAEEFIYVKYAMLSHLIDTLRKSTVFLWSVFFCLIFMCSTYCQKSERQSHVCNVLNILCDLCTVFMVECSHIFQ